MMTTLPEMTKQPTDKKTKKKTTPVAPEPKAAENTKKKKVVSNPFAALDASSSDLE